MNDDIRFDDRRSAAWRDAIVETARADQASGGSRKRVWTVIALVIAALIVSGGGVAYALSASVRIGPSTVDVSTATATPTVNDRETPTVVPPPPVHSPSPDDPIDALGAWQACEAIGLANYAADNPGAIPQPFDPEHPPTQNDDGTYQAMVGFALPQPTQGAASIVVICTVGGTLGDPAVVSWTMKDI
ncbi:hypothetical protein ASE16_15995 [Leifsonia sp. Root227]|uniref:hypothetical protein n=1 Tax=unclassified Leifsonia TaxID=2663824 RepID=UPI0006F8A3C3|nr:hypothetical protein [Leifsonia sp. Root227]KRC46894.1 hypothetical protein ASE16_15995 [Leifsonia sp. Root227]